jgi:class 3 adenylate cyclase
VARPQLNVVGRIVIDEGDRASRPDSTAPANVAPRAGSAYHLRYRCPGTRWTYTASGMTTNIAARLAAVAEGGEIIVSETTRDRLIPLIDCEDLGERLLKNGEHPVRLFRVE